MEIITINFVNDLLGARNLIKMPLLVQCSVVESFNFNGGKVQSVHVNGEECLVSREVYMAIGYEEENSKKAIQNLVPKKYKLRFGEVKPSLSRRDDIFLLHKEKVLLKEPGLYCFLLRCKKDEGEPFMEWVVETVLPREARKLASAIDEKDNQIQALEFRNEEHQHKILGLNEEINDLIAHRHVARRGCFDNVQCFIKRIAERFTHITLFNVNIDSLKNISDCLNFATQTWRWLRNGIIKMPIINMPNIAYPSQHINIKIPHGSRDHVIIPDTVKITFYLDIKSTDKARSVVNNVDRILVKKRCSCLNQKILTQLTTQISMIRTRIFT